jgi:hypothetical protein
MTCFQERLRERQLNRYGQFTFCCFQSVSRKPQSRNHCLSASARVLSARGDVVWDCVSGSELVTAKTVSIIDQ